MENFLSLMHEDVKVGFRFDVEDQESWVRDRFGWTTLSKTRTTT